MKKLYQLVTFSIVAATLMTGSCNPKQSSPTPGISTETQTIDAFFDESYKMLLLRDPELVTELALAEPFNTGNDQLTDISDTYIRQRKHWKSTFWNYWKPMTRPSSAPNKNWRLISTPGIWKTACAAILSYTMIIPSIQPFSVCIMTCFNSSRISTL